MGQALVLVGATIYLVLGTIHGVLTIRDIAEPRAFTPEDPAVRHAMESAHLALDPRVNLWQSWLGFNLSHSIGILLFGGVMFVLGWRHFAVFSGNLVIQGATLLVAGTYPVLAIRFWFRPPALGTGAAFVCFLVAALLSW